MPNSAKGIYYPDDNSPVGDLDEVFRLVAVSIDVALGDVGITQTPAVADLTSYAGDLGEFVVVKATGNQYRRMAGNVWKLWETDWISYTPTIANITVGNGTFSAAYKMTAGVCRSEGIFTMGSTSAVASTPRITHPNSFAAISRNGMDNFPLGTVVFLDAGQAAWMGFVQGLPSNTTQAEFRTSQAGGTVTQPGGLSSTVPLTWAAGDQMLWRYDFTPA